MFDLERLGHPLAAASRHSRELEALTEPGRSWRNDRVCRFCSTAAAKRGPRHGLLIAKISWGNFPSSPRALPEARERERLGDARLPEPFLGE